MLDAGIFTAIKAAGLTLDGYAIDRENGTVNADDLDPITLAKIQAVIANYAPAPPVIVVAKIDLWRAMTDAEHAQMTAGVAQQSPRIQDIFNACDTFRSDAPEWPLLQQMATQLYGAARAAQLLGQSS